MVVSTLRKKLLSGEQRPALQDRQLRIASLSAALTAVSERSRDERPKVKLGLTTGVATESLYDTGAAISAVNRETFEQMKRHSCTIKEIETLMTLSAANGDPMPTDGCFRASVLLDNRWRAGTFFVVPSLAYNMVLGIDFIRAHGLDYHARDHKVVADDKDFPLRLHRQTRIPAKTLMMVKVRSANQIKPTEEEMLVASVCSLGAPICGADAVVTSENGTDFYMMIDNVMDVEMVIRRDTVIGAVEAVKKKDCEKLPLDMAEDPKEAEPIGLEKCDPEKLQMLKETIAEQLKNVPARAAAAYMQVILENHDVFSKDKADLGRTTVMEHKIRLKDTDPAYRKQFRIPEEHRTILVTHLQNWLKLGVVSPSKSHYNSPIFLVPKKDGTMRPVLDFREVNNKSYVDKYSQREVADCIDEIGRNGSTVFSSLDLTAGFWQLPLEEESRKCTAFTIPGMGSYMWNMTPMGLLGSPATFGRMMDFVMRFLNVITYQDDLLVHSKTHEEQVEILRKCFSRLRAYGLKLNAKKCAFAQPKIPYLGFTLTPEGVLPGKDKTEAVRDSEPPRTVRQVREFVGICNYFRASIKDFAKVAAPLNRLMTKECGWSRGELPKEALEAYHKMKKALTTAPVLAYPNPKLDYHLVVDASLGLQGAPGGFGASLIQIDEEGVPRAIGYASRGLSKHERNYTAYLAELGACVFGIDYFDVYLKGRPFYLYTDHRPMEQLSKTHTRTLNRLQQLMSEYDFTIRYKPGSENVVADFLSRNPIAAVDIHREDLLELQGEDEAIQSIREHWDDPDPPEGFKKLKKRLKWENGILFYSKPDGGRALFAPKVLQAKIVRAAHNSQLGGHMGMFKSAERILSRYYWPSIQADVEDHVRSCVDCQKIKPWNRPNKAPLNPLPQPKAPNGRLHIDLFGPLTVSGGGKRMVMVMTDAFTKYVELVALKSKCAEEVAKAIMDTWITRYSTPKEILTDGGKEFANNLMKCLCKELSILHRVASPYHPDTNASAEVFNRTMKHYLTATLDGEYLDWEELLPALRIAYNTSVSKATRATPFSLVFGMEPNMPFFDMEHALTMDENYPEMLANLKAMRQKAEENNIKYKKAYKKYFDKANKVKTQKIKKGQEILVENAHKTGPNPKFHHSWLGPYPVVEVEGPRVYYQVGKKRKVAHMNRIKGLKVSQKGTKRAAEETLHSKSKRRDETQSPDKVTERMTLRGKDRLIIFENSNSESEESAEEDNEEGQQTDEWPELEDKDITMQSQADRIPEEDLENCTDDSVESEAEKEPLSRSQVIKKGKKKRDQDMIPKILDFTNESTLLDLPMDNYFPPTPAFAQYREQRREELSSSESDEESGDGEKESTEQRAESTSARAPEEHLATRLVEGQTGSARHLRSRGPIQSSFRIADLPSRPLEWKPTKQKNKATKRTEQCS